MSNLLRSESSDYYGENASPIYLHHLELIDLKMMLNGTLQRKSLFTDLPISLNSRAAHMTKLKFKVNAGTAANMVSLITFHKIFPGQALSPSATHFCVYGDSTMEALRTCHIFITLHNKRFKHLFHITSTKRSPILLSCKTMIMGLVKQLFAMNCNSGNLRETSWTSQKSVMEIPQRNHKIGNFS